MKLKVKPDTHQVDAAKFMASLNTSLLAYATGTGKSLCQITTSFLLLLKERVDKVVIVATPNSLLEIKKDFSTFSDTTPKIIKTIDEFKMFLLTDEDGDICIIKYGLIDRLSVDMLYPIIKSKRVAFSFDEVHKLMNRNTIVSQVFVSLRSAFACCYGSTATSITSELENLYWIVDFISPGFFGSYSDFVDLYVVRELQTIYLKGGRTRKVWKTIRYKNLDQLSERLSKVMIKFYPPYDIRYTTVKDSLCNPIPYIEAAEGVLEVKRKGRSNTTVTEESECDEPKSHSARMQDAQYAVNNDSAKKRLFCKVVKEQVDKGVLVYCTHHDTVALITDLLKEMGIPNDKITGKSTAKAKEKAKEWFTSDPSNKVLIITMGGGSSLNLQATNRLIFYDLPFGIGNYIQVVGRVARYFSTYESFEITYIIMKDTIDEYKLSYVEQNLEPINAILRNDMGSKIKLPKYNDYILAKLRKELIWSKQRKKKENV